MAFAFADKILHVDLTNNRVWTEQLGENWARDYLGGRGINARVLWDNVKPGIDPLGPENVLIFGAGTLTGTYAPSSGRTTVTCKSPATNRYLKSSVGGYWGIRLKLAGYDHVVIHGAAEKPVYIWIDDDQVEIRDASYLWGLTVPEADKAIKAELGTSNLETALIGPAGENKVKVAAIMCSVTFSAARGGPGAVMGSKNLKAVAVRGTGSLEVALREAFAEASMAARARLRDHGMARMFYALGTSSFISALDTMGILPSYNFQRGQFEGAEKLDGKYLVDAGFLKSRIGCGACAINCHRYCVVSKGRFAGTKTAGPEYETLSTFGSGTGTAETEAVIRAGLLCNEYGLDTISTGNIIQWAIESFERGVLSPKDTDGLELRWGNGTAVVEMVRKIAYREGIGDLLAEGVKIASEKVGQDSWKWAVQANGLEQSQCDTRGAKGYALGFAVNPRGPDHLYAQPVAEFGMTPEARALVKAVTGDEKYAKPALAEKRAEIVRWHEDVIAASDSLGFCSFINASTYVVAPEDMAEMFRAGTGIQLSAEELMFAGRRICTLERSFNVREGFDRKQDTLPYRLMHDPLPSGPAEGMVNSQAELDQMLDDYFKAHEWDIATGRPTAATLKKLGLGDVAEALCAE